MKSKKNLTLLCTDVQFVLCSQQRDDPFSWKKTVSSDCGKYDSFDCLPEGGTGSCYWQHETALHKIFCSFKLHLNFTPIHSQVSQSSGLSRFWYFFFFAPMHFPFSDKTKYMVMSREQTAGLSHSMKVDNSSIERVEEFKYLGTTLTNQNSIQEGIKSRLKLGNACYHSVQNVLSSSLLSKNLKIKIYRTIILPVVLYGCETWSLTLREELLSTFIVWLSPAVCSTDITMYLV